MESEFTVTEKSSSSPLYDLNSNKMYIAIYGANLSVLKDRINSYLNELMENKYMYM